MSTELKQMIREAARDPDRVPDVDDVWAQGRRRRALRSAGALTGVAALVLAIVVGAVTLADNRTAQPQFLGDPPSADDTGTSTNGTPTSWESLTAEQALEELAQIAERQVDDYTEPDGSFYRFQRWRSARPTDGRDVLAVKEREFWHGTDGSGRIYETHEGYQYRTETAEAQGNQSEPNLLRMEMAPGDMPPWQFDEMPRDATALEKWLRERYVEEPQPGDATPRPVSERMFTAVTDHLRSAMVPPDLRAALLRVAASTLEPDYLGPTTDPEGRNVIGFAMTREGHPTESRFYISPETGELAWEQDVTLEPMEGSDASPPITIGEVVYLDNAIVTQLPPRPDDVEDAPAAHPTELGPSEEPAG